MNSALQDSSDDFFDWEYAKKVWYELNTNELYDPEWSKWEVDFEPWLKLFHKNGRAALKALETYPQEQKFRIQRGYDLQLTWDLWLSSYKLWYNGYEENYVRQGGRAETFDDRLDAIRKARGNDDCREVKRLVGVYSQGTCGPMPDWRMPDMIKKEKVMMRKVHDKYKAMLGQ